MLLYSESSPSRVFEKNSKFKFVLFMCIQSKTIIETNGCFYTQETRLLIIFVDSFFGVKESKNLSCKY